MQIDDKELAAALPYQSSLGILLIQEILLEQDRLSEIQHSNCSSLRRSDGPPRVFAASLRTRAKARFDLALPRERALSPVDMPG